MIETFKKARNCGTPIVAITSFDPEATMATIQGSYKGVHSERASSIPFIQWDIMNGFAPRNEVGRDAISEALGSDPIESTYSPASALEKALKLPEKSILMMLNMRQVIDKPEIIQAIWNLRDEYKTSDRTLVLIGTEITFPSELKQDIIFIDEELPDERMLREIVLNLTEGNGIELKKEVITQVVDALRGVAAFPAEQITAMNVDPSLPTKINIDGLWDHKRQLISKTPGLKVYSGKEKFDNIGGCNQVKKYLTRVIEGREAPRVIVFIDEGEKMFAGSSSSMGDSTGISQDYLGSILAYMEDNECDGAIFVGPPGAAKSAIAKATGNEAEVPTIMMDLGGMKGSLVGQSETRLREALKVISAVGSNRVYFIMTCNRITSLPPELKRRFTSGTFFFDLPNKEERAEIWSIYLKKYQLVDKIDFDDEGWTGAEIRNACRMAYRQNITLNEASKFIVPVSKSAADQIEQLRNQAQNSFLSANEEGVYSVSKIIEAKTRKIKQ